MDKRLLVNGIGVTGLTPITRMIAHLPLAFLQSPPQNALVICFGTGTTHRSMLSWGISSTAVELVPSVVSVFSYFHADAEQLEQSPRSHIVVNDGRFYLERSPATYDVIVLDPPPPVEAAASSLLYSKEFYAIARPHLRPDGILQQWYPLGFDYDPAIPASIAKSLKESFPYVRAFRSVESSGFHFLASDSPIPSYSAATLASHLPRAATVDLLEWGPATTAEEQFARVLNQEVSMDEIIAWVPNVPALQDDRPSMNISFCAASRIVSTDRPSGSIFWHASDGSPRRVQASIRRLSVVILSGALCREGPVQSLAVPGRLLKHSLLISVLKGRGFKCVRENYH
jgi:spermidine synthase